MGWFQVPAHVTPYFPSSTYIRSAHSTVSKHEQVGTYKKNVPEMHSQRATSPLVISASTQLHPPHFRSRRIGRRPQRRAGQNREDPAAQRNRTAHLLPTGPASKRDRRADGNGTRGAGPLTRLPPPRALSFDLRTSVGHALFGVRHKPSRGGAGMGEWPWEPHQPGSREPAGRGGDRTGRTTE